MVTLYFLFKSLHGYPWSSGGDPILETCSKLGKKLGRLCRCRQKAPLCGVLLAIYFSFLWGCATHARIWLYGEIAHTALKANAAWVLPLIVLAMMASMIPIARLGIFMFAKPVRHELILLHQPRQAFLIITCAVLIFATNLICLAIPKIYEFQDLFPLLSTFKF